MGLDNFNSSGDYNSDERYKDEDWLKEQLNNNTKNGIADKCGVDWSTIDYWATKFKDEDESWRDRDKLTKLYKDEKMSASEIADKYNANRHKVLKCIKELGINTRTQKESVELAHSKNRGNVNADVIGELNKDSAYVFGVIISDGYIHQDDYDIRLEVKSKKFAQAFYESLQSLNLNPKLKSKNDTFIVRSHSSIFVKNFYNEIDMVDIKKWNRIHSISVLRGIYDSEGSYTLSGSDSKQIRIAVTDGTIADIVNYLTEKLNIDSTTNVYERKTTFDGKQYDVTVYNINIYKDVDKFLNIVEPNIKTQPSNKSSSAGSI